MPVYKYVPKNGQTVVVEDYVVPPAGLEFKYDNVNLNRYTVEILNRYVDGVFDLPVIKQKLTGLVNYDGDLVGYVGKDDKTKYFAEYLVDSNGNSTGLVLGPNQPLAQIQEVFTWSNLPAANAYSGNTVYVTDIGPKGSYWKSDGVNWGLINGSVVLYRSSISTRDTITGLTNSAQEAFNLTLPANIMGPDGELEIKTKWTVTNNANIKLVQVYLGTTNFTSPGGAAAGSGLVSSATGGNVTTISNRGVTNQQLGSNGSLVETINGSSAWATGTIDTTSIQNLSIRIYMVTPSDTAKLESITVTLRRT